MAEPSDQDVIASAQAAIEEARRQIEFQVGEADAIHTRATGIVTLAGVAAGIVVGRIHADTEMQRLAAVVTGVAFVALFASTSQALRPRAGWSFGSDPRALLATIERYSHRVVLVALAESLVDAREMNARVLRRKQGWYAAGLRAAVAALLALGWMIQNGALQ